MEIKKDVYGTSTARNVRRGLTRMQIDMQRALTASILLVKISRFRCIAEPALTMHPLDIMAHSVLEAGMS